MSCLRFCHVALQDRKNALAGIDILRKICNHPDLLQRKQWESVKQYGDPVRSGKLTVAMKVTPTVLCALTTAALLPAFAHLAPPWPMISQNRTLGFMGQHRG